MQPQFEKDIAAELKKFQVLYELAVAMTSENSLDQNLGLVAAKSRELLKTDTAHVALRDESAGELYMHTLAGFHSEAFSRIRIPIGKGLGGKVASTRQGYIVSDYATDRHFERIGSEADKVIEAEELVSGMGVPLQAGAQNVGVLFVFNRRPTRFHQADLDALLLIGNLAAVEIARKWAERKLQETRAELEVLVSQRTAKLMITNRNLTQEIDERRRVEAALRESEEKYRLLIENAKDAIFVTQDHKISFINPIAMAVTGYSQEELKNRPFLDFIHPGDRDLILQRYLQRMNGEEISNSVSFRILTREGQTKYMDLNAVIITWEGRPGVLNFMRDITPQKNMEAQLLQSQKMEAIGTLAGGIAHNFNNMLMGIQGNVALMRLHLGGGHALIDKLDKIDGIVTSGTQMTRQLLGYARGGQYEVRAIDLNRLVSETTEVFRLTRRDIKIENSPGAHRATIRADKSQIEQVLWNLFVNAADAMPKGGNLFISTHDASAAELRGALFRVEPGAYVCLTVRDTGIGIDPKTQELIFEPFFTTKPVDKGTGLGLASAYGIVKAHGGYILVESKPGNGATFKIYLPVSGQAVSKASGTRGEIVTGRETLLMVEDEEMVLDIAEQILKRLGYRVLTARDGHQALQLFESRQVPIDLVILDMIMPGMGGGEVFERLRAIDPNVKVLLASGYSLNEQSRDILARGCNGFIQKPFNLKQLSLKVREILDAP